MRQHFASNNISETAWQNTMKHAWDVPCMKVLKSCSKNSIPGRTLVAMATKKKYFKKLQGFELIYLVWYTSTRIVQIMALGSKISPP
jgi:hypothetical protein